MLPNEIQILRRLAFLVAFHDLTAGHVLHELTLVPRPMLWSEARRCCQEHFVDLAVPSSVEQYQALFNATAASSAMLWVGLRVQSAEQGWRWVSGEELTYDRWFRRSHSGRCAAFETLLLDERRLLSRYCDEWHVFVCQGPLPPHQVTVHSVSSSDSVDLSWTISEFMRMTPHAYNVTWCSAGCQTKLFPYNHDGDSSAAFMNITIHGLSEATPTSIHISASVVRTDMLTGGNTTLQSRATVVQVRAAGHPEVHSNLLIIILKSPKPLYLSLLLWILYCVLKKCHIMMERKEKKLSAEEAVVELMVPDNQCSLVQHQTPAAA